MKTLYQHKALGGAVNITTEPRYPVDCVVSPSYETVATFGNGDMGHFAYGMFLTGLAQGGTHSLYDEDSAKFIVGDVGDLAS